MRYLATWLVLLPLSLVGAVRTPRNHDTHDYFNVEVDPTTSPEELAAVLGAHCEGPLGQLPNHFTFSTPKAQSSLTEQRLDEARRRRRRRRSLGETGTFDATDGVLWAKKQTLRPRLHKRMPPPPPLDLREDQGSESELTAEQKAAVEQFNNIVSTLGIGDPIFNEQWHIFNSKQIGHDMNVTGLWLEGITGNGSISAIVDDGLDMYSDDLKGNYYAEGSYDFNDQTDEPKPRLFDDKHGTRCAGEVAAVKNNVCGVGMAYDSKIAGIRILSKIISDEDEAIAMNYGYDKTDIYSCSWGPADDGKSMEVPPMVVQRAMVNAVQKGRDGRGSIYVFAAGNGAASGDNCNFDGYTNSIYSITVGAIDRAGNHPYYSEACSAQLVVTYSSGEGDSIHTTDVGTNECSAAHGGTSAAGPLMVGVAALALSVRPDLTWRDLQYLCVNTAVPVHEDDSEWQTTTIGKKFSHQFGYGKVDSYAYVQAAKDFVSVKPQAWYHSPWLSVLHSIPQGDKGLASTFEVTKDMMKKANLERLEHVTVTMNVNHTRRGDLSVELRSPSGIVSHLSVARRFDEHKNGYQDWNFMSVAHWGEDGIGTWTVVVKDAQVNDDEGTFIDWRLNLWGEAIDGAKQKLHPLPDEHDDDHEVLPAPVATTSVDPGTIPTDTPAAPSDHPERPTKPKPGGEDQDEETKPEISASASTTATSPVESTPAQDSPTPTHTVSDSFLPSFFPTFGVSKRTQIWIYGSIGLILVFCAGLGTYFFVQRRKRLRNDPRDDYEFELVGDDEDRGHGPGTNGSGAGTKGKRRAGELYDAFAGESDEELFSDASDEEPYTDEKVDEKTGLQRKQPDSED